MIHRRPGGRSDYRSALARDGEIGIGAYARRVWRRNLSIAALGVAFMFGSWWLYKELRPTENSRIRDKYPVKVRCANTGCGYEGILYVQPNEKFPLFCPQCQKRSCRQLWRCRYCNLEFLPERAAQTVKCPHCGSVTVGSAASEPPAENP